MGEARGGDAARAAPSAGRGGREEALVVGAMAAVLAAITLAYAPALGGAFTFDDAQLVAGRVPADAGAILREIPASTLGRGRAVTDLTFALDRARAGISAPAFHATNLAIHLATVLAVFLLASALLRRASPPAGADAAHERPRRLVAVSTAAVFGLHPLASQAVGYVIQRQEALASLLCVLALVLALRAEARLDRIGIAAYAVGTALFALALGAKSSAVSAPAALVLAALAFPRPETPRRGRVLLLAAPWLALGLLHVSTLAHGLGGNAEAGFDMPGVAPGSYWASQGRVLLTYARLVVWPTGQSVDHAFSLSSSFRDPAALASFAAVVGVAICSVAVLFGPRRLPPWMRLAAFGFIWFLLVLLPTSVLPIDDVIVEHRTYLALFGPALAFSVATCAALGRDVPGSAVRRGAVALFLVATCAALGVALDARARLWGDPRALWEEARDRAPGHFRPHVNFGRQLELAGDLPGAVAEYEAALAIDGARTLQTPLVAAGVAKAFVLLGRADVIGRAVEERLGRRGADPGFGAVLAEIRVAQGRAGEAELLARLALDRGSTAALTYQALGLALVAQGRLPEAADTFRQAVARAPEEPNYRMNYAGTLAGIGRVMDACAVLGDDAVIAVESRVVLAPLKAQLRCPR